ncbi:MAG: PQQ-binding-like beta-propeller repeat protein [Planctomycetota bacterium]|nr:PQQ-binding-like beta-propeller repeat protein [Planctomycetota bacterium]MEC9097098.1 PQQ-binding-like beta-propeller repeat protein [Planctomycetota bacterium]
MVTILLLPVFCHGDDWRQFRGNNSAGIADNTPTLSEFGPGHNELWSVPVGSGHSSPCIVGQQIILTASRKNPKELQVLSLDRKTGNQNWSYGIQVEELERGHPSFDPASSTAASDGRCIVAYFGSYGLVCLDMQGKLLWEKRLPLTKSYAGNAISPIITGNKVILYRGNYIDHYLTALDKETGKEVWKVRHSERFTPNMACTAVPLVHQDQLIVHAARSIQSFEIETGTLKWELKCLTTATSTPVIAGGEVIVATWNQTGEEALRPLFPTFDELLANHDKDGDQLINRAEMPKLFYFHRNEGAEAPQNGYPFPFNHADPDKNGKIGRPEWQAVLNREKERRRSFVEHGLIAIALNSKGLLQEKDIRRLESQSIPEVPSPIYANGLVYMIKNGGLLTCVNVRQGKRIYRMRTGGSGTHYASPVIADGKLYTTAGDGKISVIELGTSRKLLATNDMQDYTYATPAICNGIIYIRTHSKLYAFGTRD